jgi:hypothetical protein
VRGVGRIQIGEVLLAALAVGVLVTVASALIRLATRGRDRPPVFGAALLDGALLASLAGVLVATLSPIELFGVRPGRASEVNLRPLEALRGAPEFYAVINTVLLAPTIILLAQRWRRAGIVRLVLAGVAFSFAIEILQLAHPVRGTNVDDLALNSAGALGAAIVGVAIRTLRRGPGGGTGGPPRSGSSREVSAAGRSR